MARQDVVATVIGDVVGSKGAGDRQELHRALLAGLEQVNQALEPVTPLWVTAGDEYQGCFAALGGALRATLRIRLALRAVTDVRHGVGWGAVTVLDEEPRVEDGPGWWAARAAIETAEASERKAATRGLRTAYARAADVDGPDPGLVNAALVLRDQLLHGVGEESLSVLAGMLAGMSQKEIAADLGISASAVSQRIRRDGLAALVRADELLGGVA